ncbi:MAG TPA: GNAT family N-acetyltransferase [Candidatus Pullichristensenella stercorigallinarum]|uniref:GNAT family N-acetyltransferase n=1 Tax=Candidatus Pullichristensenella stercorigallinarum TaxID=2840909 RepID=A0A9D1CXS5_9FIRM|nr:GNAT family N-acetyltransferase [Candidatus Pullichristensenella stercorigallinarum]
MNVRKYEEADLPRMAEIWNQVVEDGIAFPQLQTLKLDSARDFFAGQSFSAVAEEDGEILGLYILHPNNEGRCGHIANASYAVDRSARGKGAGEALVSHCLETAAALGFRLMQFNAVVKSNLGAIHLYEKLGFVRIGEVPGGFLMKDGHYEDIVLFYHTL